MSKKPFVWFFCVIASVFFLFSCFNPLNVPEKVHVQGNPALELPLGGTEVSIKKYLSSSVLQNSMGGGNTGMTIYDYNPPDGPPDNTQTFLLRYSMPPLNVDAGENNFEFKPSDASQTEFKVAIPSMQTDNTSIYNGRIDAAGSIPVNSIITQPITLVTLVSNSSAPSGETTSFKGAVVKEGYLVVSGDSSLDLSRMTLSVEGRDGQSSALPQSTDDGNGSRRFNLAGINLPEGGLTVTPGGTIHSNSAISNANITADVDLQSFSSMTVETNATLTEEVKMDLSAMAKWVKLVTLDKIGFKLKIEPQSIADALAGEDVSVTVEGNMLFATLKNSDIGELTGDNGITEDIASGKEAALRFTSDDTMSSADRKVKFSSDYAETNENFGSDIKASENKIEIGVNAGAERKSIMLTLEGDIRPGAQFSAATITPEVIFDWKKATVNPKKVPGFDNFGTNKQFPGGSGINLSSMFSEISNSFINKIEFGQVDMFLYLNGPEAIIGNIALKVEASYDGETNPLIADDSDPTQGATPKHPEKPLDTSETGPDPAIVEETVTIDGKTSTEKVYKKPLLEEDAHYYTGGLVDVFNDKPSNLQLEYSITMADEITVTKDEASLSGSITITPEIIIMLPLNFRIKPDDGKDYASVTFVDELSKGGADLFGRKKGDNSAGFDVFKSAGLNIKYINHIGLEGNTVYLTLGDEVDPIPLLDLEQGDHSYSVSLTQRHFNVNPFNPGIEIRSRLASDGKGTLKIRRGDPEKGAVLEIVSIDASVETKIDQDFKLNGM